LFRLCLLTVVLILSSSIFKVRETIGGFVLFHPEAMYPISEVFPGSYAAHQAEAFVVVDTAAGKGGVPGEEVDYIFPFDDAESAVFPESTTPIPAVFSSTWSSLQETIGYNFCCNLLPEAGMVLFR
jgi:hypothetical protein